MREYVTEVSQPGRNIDMNVVNRGFVVDIVERSGEDTMIVFNASSISKSGREVKRIRMLAGSSAP